MANRRFFAAGAALVAAALLVRLALFGVSLRHIPVSSDESMTMLMAKGIAEPRGSATWQAKQAPPYALGRFPLLFVSVPYIFPIECYLIAPVERLLPKTPFGARAVHALLSLLTLGIGLRILHRYGGGLRASWPGALLLLFPSTYLLVFGMGYALPGYTVFLFLAALVTLWALRYGAAAAAGRSALLAFLLGLVAALTFCGTLMALPLIVAAGAAAVCGGRWRRAVASAPAFAAGAALGLAPFFLARWLYPGANAAVSARLPLAEALRRLWDPTLTYTVPTALGVRCTIFPDADEAFALVPALVRASGAVWFALLVAGTAVCAWGFARRAWRDRWPSLVALDLFVALSWMALLLFLLNARAHHGCYRYILLLVWCWPFLVGLLYRQAGRYIRCAIGAGAAGLALLNAATAAGMMGLWSAPGFAADKVFLHDLRPLIAGLEQKGIAHCYASTWNSFRISFASDERIVCGPPCNEYFPDWPMPYVDAVDAATNVAVALSSGFRFLPDAFERDLAAQRVRYRKERMGDFSVYTAFRPARRRAELRIAPSDVRASASHAAAAAPALTDGRYGTRWRSHEAQTTNMWIELALPRTAAVDRVSLYYDRYPYDLAQALDVLAREGEGPWQPVRTAVRGDLEPFDLRNGHPVFQHQLQTIRFPPVRADRVRIAIAAVNPGRDWTVGEVEVYTAGEGEASGGAGGGDDGAL